MKKTNQIRNNRINVLFSLAALLLFPYISNAQLKVVASSGKVGLGITSSTTPTAPELRSHILGDLGFPVTSGSTQTGVLRLEGTGSNVVLDFSCNWGTLTPRGAALQATSRTDLSLTYDLALNPNGGNVGIGVPKPGYQLQLSTNSAGKPISSTWIITSDIRTKTNVESYAHGLDLIRQVKLVSYQYNGVANTPIGEKGIGVIAQDFKNVFPNSVKPFPVNNDSTNSGDPFLGVDLHELFVTNIGAVQQLDNIVSTKNTIVDSTIKALNSKIDALQNQILNCCAKTPTDKSMINNTSSSNEAGSTSPILYQNVPNPFNQQTSIQYFIPTTSQSASIMVFDLNGKLMSTIPVTKFGNGAIIINGNQLNPGMFVYSLVVDEKIIDTKRMILTQ